MENNTISLENNVEINENLNDGLHNNLKNEEQNLKIEIQKNTLNTNLKENTINKKVERQSNFELLRIIAMIMIIFSHCRVDFSKLNNSNITNKFIYNVITGFGQVGVSLFIMISGYFLSKSKFKFQTFLKLILQVLFYSIISMLIKYFTNQIEVINFSIILNCFFIITNVEWWFFSVYVFLFLIYPFLNILINKLNKKQFLNLIFIMSIFLIFIPTLRKEVAGGYIFCVILIVIFYYFIGAFVRLNSEIIKNKQVIYFGFFISLFVFIYINLFFQENYLVEKSSLFVFTLSLFIFLIITTFKFYSKKINFIASTTFGIYLLHECIGARNYIWNKLFCLQHFINTKGFLLMIVLSVTLVFIVSCIFEILRIYLLEKIFFKFINKSKKYKIFITNINNFYPYKEVTKKIKEKEEDFNYNKLFLQFLIIFIIVFIVIQCEVLLKINAYKIFILLILTLYVFKFIFNFILKNILEIKKIK